VTKLNTITEETDTVGRCDGSSMQEIQHKTQDITVYIQVKTEETKRDFEYAVPESNRKKQIID
jgi:hypothetical protein